MMPMGQYNIGIVNALLVDIGFVLMTNHCPDCPRSIKRLVNSSLIQIFTDVKNKKSAPGFDNTAKEEDVDDTITAEDEFLMFALLCLQIAYPAVYSLLVEEPDFLKWDDNFAFKHTKRSEEEKERIF